MPSASARTSSRSSSLIIAGTAVAVITGAAVVGWQALAGRPQSTVSEPPPTATSSVADHRDDPISIIVSSPNDDDCHRYQLDKSAGGISDEGTTDCAYEPGGQTTRIDAILKGFRDR